MAPTAVQAQAAAISPMLLDPVFGDHAVLQRGRPIPVWGRAVPGSRVAVSLAASSVTTTADATGRWRADLPAQKAGGPHALTVSAGDVTQRLGDVIVGDVWLCSGQSNMELSLRQAANADAEIAAADDAALRLFNIPRRSLPQTAAEPQALAAWTPTTPETARDFSAACYFMARDLRRADPSVAIGLIAASWGGSIIEDWLSRDALAAMEPYQPSLQALDAYVRSPQEGEALWQRISMAWWRSHDPGLQGGWYRERLDETDWRRIPAEGAWETTQEDLATFDGVIWLRTKVELTRAQARQAATLDIGPIDDADSTWINGRYLGGMQGWDTPRRYRIRAGSLKAGRNVIAVGVLDSGGGGGAWGPAADKRLVFDDGSSVPLNQPWLRRVAAPLAGLPPPPRTPWVGGSGVSTLYNGMIAPVAPYGLKGVAWYQGESNAGDAAGYAVLLPALFADWRRAFDNPDLSMLVVQLANFGPASDRPQASGWAALREVQRRTVNADARAGLAVSIDVGDRYDLHPTNKQEIGRRLALEARRLDGQTVARSVQPEGVRRADGEIRIRYPEKAILTVVGASRPVGFELCGAGNDCRFVDAMLEGAEVILGDARPTDAKVRFCWADSPLCNLYGPEGLLAVPFELETPPSASVASTVE
ncbi:sialate O-acetylesterase [Brevundimonas sp. PAMC22021]|nr:sialate O-acetylesterase [Brevundimonas sp. PAMC22021]